jgi:F-type H+-transporting ATPase subunit delta
MRHVVRTIEGNKDLQTMLGSPVVSNVSKKETLNTLFKDVHQLSGGLLNMLVDNKRVSILSEVALKYIILNEQRKGEGVAYVTTALPLTRELEKHILDRVKELTGNDMSIENKIDESIIGGFVLRVGDLQYDASISNKLNRIKTTFTNTL